MSRWPETQRADGRQRRTGPERAGERNGAEGRHRERAQDREPDATGDRRGPRTRRDRQRDPGQRHVSFEERKRLALHDLCTYRAISFRDLSDARFDGHDFVARRAISQLHAGGLVVQGRGFGPKGRPFALVAATRAGVAATCSGGRGSSDQRYWHGLVKPSEAHHDTAVYRAARETIAELERDGCTVTRVRIDAELKSVLARVAERARTDGGPGAARAAQHNKARELGLPVADGKVHIPDVQIEYERADGPAGPEPGRANVEVVTASYKEGSIRAKAALGFSLSASGSAAASKMQAALGRGGRIDFGETEGRGSAREEDVGLEF